MRRNKNKKHCDFLLIKRFYFLLNEIIDVLLSVCININIYNCVLIISINKFIDTEIFVSIKYYNHRIFEFQEIKE